MDIFQKCYEPSLAKELKAAGVYPYFHALQSRQDVEVHDGGQAPHHAGFQQLSGSDHRPRMWWRRASMPWSSTAPGAAAPGSSTAPWRCTWSWRRSWGSFCVSPASSPSARGSSPTWGIISALVGRHDYVICDRENHASIYAGCQMSYGKMLRYRHSDMAELEKQLQRVPEKNGALIASPTACSPWAATSPSCRRSAPWPRSTGHGSWWTTPTDWAFWARAAVVRPATSAWRTRWTCIWVRFSKSLASLGGYMAASEEVADYVRHASRPFIFSASIPPANCATALAALRHLEQHPGAARTGCGA